MNKQIKKYQLQVDNEKQINRILNAEIEQLRIINNELHLKIAEWTYDYKNLKEEYEQLNAKTLKNRLKRTFLGKLLIKFKKR